MFFPKNVIFLMVVITINHSLAEIHDDPALSPTKDGRQLGAISFLQRLLPTQVHKGYAPSQFSQRCPLCDSSVYSYCGEKLLHDACCCTNPYAHELPYQCRLADCSFLHSNSCREHKLIANCCCTDEYRTLLKSLSV